MQGGEVERGRAFREPEQFDAHHFVGVVVVKDHARRDFFGVDDGGVVKEEIEGIGFFINVDLYSLPFMVRSSSLSGKPYTVFGFPSL